MERRKGGPIYPEELQRYRDQIKVGQKKVVETKVRGDGFCRKKVKETCTVIEKHKYFFVGQTSSGSRRNINYIEMLIMEREKMCSIVDAEHADQ